MADVFASGWLAAEDLTEPEAALVEAVLAHRWWEPPPVLPEEVTDAPQDADWGAVRTVRAQVLYQLLTGKGRPSANGKDWDFEPRAVRVRGVRIVGQLDLEAATLRCPLALVGCWLDHDSAPVLLREATVPSIRLRGCWLPAGLDAGQVTTRGNVSLERCRVQGEVRLFGGHVGGHLELSGGKFCNDGGTALDASRLRVDQSMTCVEFEAAGDIRLSGAHIGGQLDLNGGKLRNADTTAIYAYRLRVDHDVFCQRGFEAAGEVELAGARIGGNLRLNGKFRNPKGTALYADWLQVDRDILCGEEFEADGAIWLTGGHIRGNLGLNGKFRNPGGTALKADGLRVDRDVFCWEGFEADGEVQLWEGHIGGELTLNGRFRNKGGIVLYAAGLHVDRDVYCWEGFDVDGEVQLLGGHIGGKLALDGKFRNPGGTALNAGGLQVDRDVYCAEEFEAAGEVHLDGGHVGGKLLIYGKFRNPNGTALNAHGIRVDSRLDWEPTEITGTVSFEFGSVGVWVDSEASLGLPVILDRLRYDALDSMPPEVTAAQRIAWLDRDPYGYSPQPYSQLASVYRSEGHDRAARQVLVASQTRRRRQVSGWRGWLARVWSGLLRVTVGYGYRPWLALLWLLALIVGGSLVVDGLPGGDFVAGSGAPAFNSLLYTVDVLLPFIDLGYSEWVAVGAAQIVTVVLVVLGWVLATAVIAAFAGVLRRGE